MAGNLKTTIIHGLEPSSTGTVDYTVSGFGTPVAAIVLSSLCTSFDIYTNSNVSMIGFTDGSTHRCCGQSEVNGQGNAHSWCHSTDKLYVRQHEYGILNRFEADFSTWVTDGIRINWTKVDSDFRKKFMIILIGGTDVSAKVGDFTPSSSVNGTVDVTGLGLDPEVVFFMGTGSDFNASFTNVQNGDLSFGFATSKDGTEKNSCVYKSGDHYATTSDHVGGIFTDRCCRIYDAVGNSLDYSLEMTDVDTGEFTVTTRDANNNVFEVGYLALELGGDDYDIVNQVLPDSNGNQDFPSSGSLSFGPEHLFAIASWNTTQDSDVKDDYDLMIGCANEADGDDACVTIMGDDNVATTLEKGWISQTYSITVTEADTSPNKKGYVDSWGTDKVTINFTNSGTRSCYSSLLLIGEAVLTISPNGIVSGEAFGSPSVIPEQFVTPNSIASGEAFGSPTVDQSLSILGIASAEAFGSPSLVYNQPVAPNGIASGEAFGSLTIGLGINPSSIVSGEAFGSPTLNMEIRPASINSGEAFGNPLVAYAQTVSLSSITSAEAFGSPVISTGGVPILLNSIPSGEAFGLLSIGTSILVSGIPSAESFGFPWLLWNYTLAPNGIASEEVFGSPTVVPGAAIVAPTGIVSAESFGSLTIVYGSVAIAPNGIVSGESFGSPTIEPGAASVNPNSIASGESFGQPSLSVGIVDIEPEGIVSQENFGEPYVTVSGVQVSPLSITSAEGMGTPSIVPGIVQVLPSSITSGESFGSPSVIPAGVSITPNGIASQESFGSVNIGLSIQVQAIISGEVFGSPTISVGNVDVAPEGIASLESFGEPIVRHVLVLNFDGVGIPSAEVFGTPTVSVIVRNEFMEMMETDLQDGFFELTEFAETASYEFKNGATISLPVIFDYESYLVDPDTGAEVISRQPMIQAQTSDFSYHPDKGDKVVVRGVRYQVISHEPDGTGVSILRLHHERTV